MGNIFSVRQLTERIRLLVEQRFPYIWVRGEVINIKRPSSGHIYFSLKEDDYSLPCVWFRGQQNDREKFDPLTGEVYENGPKASLAHTLEDGQAIICAGRITVYGPRGNYQLIVDLAQASGEGHWRHTFEALKQKLYALGYFDPERKRPLPKNPRRVALITSPSGAAIRDFIRVSTMRGLSAKIRVYPSLVQGDEAPAQLITALENINHQAWAEVIVLIRGGGSIQDLWAFNDEKLAVAIFNSALPVLIGVGHEIDHSIADFVADFSAATPSHAAQLLWSERSSLTQQLDELELHLNNVWRRFITQPETALGYLERHLAALSPQQNAFLRQADHLTYTMRRLTYVLEGTLRNKESSLASASFALNRYKQGQTYVASASKIDHFAPRLHGALRQHLAKAELALSHLGEQIAHLRQNLLMEREYQFNNLETRLTNLNPYAPLERGYSIVRDQNGKFVRSVMDVCNGEMLDILVRDGSFPARAEKPEQIQ